MIVPSINNSDFKLLFTEAYSRSRFQPTFANWDWKQNHFGFSLHGSDNKCQRSNSIRTFLKELLQKLRFPRFKRSAPPSPSNDTQFTSTPTTPVVVPRSKFFSDYQLNQGLFNLYHDFDESASECTLLSSLDEEKLHQLHDLSPTAVNSGEFDKTASPYTTHEEYTSPPSAYTVDTVVWNNTFYKTRSIAELYEFPFFTHPMVEPEFRFPFGTYPKVETEFQFPFGVYPAAIA